MSSSGTLSNYYVDSLIGHEGDEVFAGRFGPPGPGTQGRPAGVADSPAAAAAEFASCSFAPKSAVFSASWSAVPAQPPAAAAMSGLYHPYVPPPPLAASASEPGRYMRSWMEPLPSFPGGAGGGVHPRTRVSETLRVSSQALLSSGGVGVKTLSAGGPEGQRRGEAGT